MAQILDGSRLVQFHTHRHNDILTVIRLAQEFGFTPVIQHGSDSWKVAREIAAAGLPVSVTYVEAPGGKEEVLGVSMRVGALLEEAGVDVSFNTDDYVLDSRLLLRYAALNVRNGMSETGALEALTLAGARHLGLDDRVGSLEPGKDGDFVVLSGEPFSTYTRVLETWVEGERVFDFSDPDHRRFATGGYDTYRTHAHHHDLGGAQ
jgi:imidazolonepropionase-like amidohydrolase